MKLWKILPFVIVISCNEIKDCQLDPNRDYATMIFYSIDSARLETPKKTVKDMILISDDTLTSSGALGLYLNPDDTAVAYSFVTDSATYLLEMSYKHSLFLYSTECEPTFSYKDLKVSETTFDSVAIINTILKSDYPLNLEIYF